MSEPITIHVGGLAVAAPTVVRLAMGDCATVAEFSEAVRQVQRAAEHGAREGLLQMKRRGDPRLH